MDPQPVNIFSDDNEVEKAERTSLLNELDGLVDSTPFSRGLWACLRVADLGSLRRIVEGVKHSPFPKAGLAGYEYLLQESNLLRHWTQRTRVSSRATSTTTTPPQPSTPTRPDVSGLPSTFLKRRRDARDQLQSELCRQRDRRRCVVTKSGEPIEVAHIFPFAMRGFQTEEARSQMYSPWEVLKIFWPEEKVERWLSAIQATTETPKNLLCLAPHVHAYQGKAYFALKHLGSSEDNTSCTVMFVWLPHFDDPQSLRVSTEPFAAPVVQLREDSTGGVVGLWDVTTGLPISTGSRIVLETTDPVGLPLPDADLLELHWVLQRVAAMAGAAEPRDDSYRTDDEDDEMFGVWADEDSDLSDLSLPQKPTTSMASNGKNKMVLDLNPCDPQSMPVE
ncbi:uncharacterized protein GIQ15_00227 [Arthroderma uncinatum]|uniref:uncharacterized protein n=1 Tax=Arthroderma uncinatum TaxID=74035 RepID=UPI00144A9025|nr:uncharacterized protein GIQ15_00227 [Arthroderma uncinatum]KAF3490710.1 hypothetical protein GIQ15_00227 [Arthroderma uncinatum]